MGIILETYLRTMPMGFGAVYRAYHGDPIGVDLYLPSNPTEAIAAATWQAPFVGSLILPGYLSVVPYLVAPLAPAAPAAAAVTVAASATAMVHHLYHMDESDPNHSLMQMIGSHVSL